MARVAIVGSRNYPAPDAVRAYVRSLDDDDVVVSGGAKGVDSIAAQAARERGLEVVEHLPEYGVYGRKAPMVRNTTIVEDADRVAAFWDLRSKGTRDSINKALRLGRHVLIHGPDGALRDGPKSGISE